MVPDFFIDRRPHNGITYEEFFNALQKRAEKISIGLDNTPGSSDDYTKLNYQRSLRINKTYSVSPELAVLANQITEPQLWMVITEDWCGDSAQNLPHLAKIAAVNPMIDLRIIYRDENLDIMDRYLTNGKSRSIPKLVAFDMKGNELFQWGPRPRKAQDLMNELKAEGLTKDQSIEQLHLWYGRDRGKTLEFEFKNILNDLKSKSM